MFYLKADDEDRLLQLPIPPQELKTVVGDRNITLDTVGLGEVAILKDIGLRKLNMDIILPMDLELPFVQRSTGGGIIAKPIFYLTWFREVMARKVPLRLIVSRILPDGSTSFPGNMHVSLEGYTVNESGGGVGDYAINLRLREFVTRSVEVNKATEVAKVSKTSSAKTYTIKSGDTLWLIAKRVFGDGSRYKELAVLNNITDYNHLQIGTVIRLE